MAALGTIHSPLQGTVWAVGPCLTAGLEALYEWVRLSRWLPKMGVSNGGVREPPVRILSLVEAVVQG